MFGLSGEHLLILAGVLLVFGPRKLPELGSSIGKAVKNFKEGLNGPSTSGKVEVIVDQSEGEAKKSNPSKGTSAPNQQPPSAQV